MAFIDKIQNKEAFVGVYDLWARKNPSYEVHYEKEIIKLVSGCAHGNEHASCHLCNCDQLFGYNGRWYKRKPDCV